MEEITQYDVIYSKNIVCVGDSITAGFTDETGIGVVPHLSRMIAENHPLKYFIYNAGISSYTSTEAAAKISSVIERLKPKILTIMLGVNDICVREDNIPEQPRVSISERLKNWKGILGGISTAQLKTLVIGPLPTEVAAVRYTEQIPDGTLSYRFHNAEILDYNNMLENLTRTHNVPFLRLYEQWKNASGQGLFADGLHPNAKGHILLARNIYDGLRKFDFI